MDTVEPQQVWVLITETAYGTDISAHRTETGAWDNLAGFVAEWWDREMGSEALPSEPREAIDAYFEMVEDENYTLELVQIYE